MNLQYSFIIPVYNRPDEVNELLDSLLIMEGGISFEVVIVEDGSSNTCEHILEKYQKVLNIRYFFTENRGAGKSRNFGMQQASGNYFLILDSDCLVPKDYLIHVNSQLKSNFTDAFGGPDAAHESFTSVQKAINYAMTSVFTTGGIRGKKKAIGKFQPRSFNFGLSKKAFEKTKGFSDLKIGEDIDLTFRLWETGFETQLIDAAFVYHKRRANFRQFFKQTNNFGKARPILNKRYPGTAKITYWFPSVFLVGFVLACLFFTANSMILMYAYASYFSILLIDATLNNKSLKVGLLSMIATAVQFYGYGTGFLYSMISSKKKP